MSFNRSTPRTKPVFSLLEIVAVGSPSSFGVSSKSHSCDMNMRIIINHCSSLRCCSEGRGAAAEVDAFLSEGSTRLPTAGGIVTRVCDLRASSSERHTNNGYIPQRFVGPKITDDGHVNGFTNGSNGVAHQVKVEA